MEKYVIGVDFGTLSGRAAVVSVQDGRELAHAVYEYPHGVMDRQIPTGRTLPPDWALQHPADWLEVLHTAIPEAIRLSGISTDDLIGIGVDATACTVLPVKADGTPLCFLPEYQDTPHAYAKLWKHHGAQAEAERLNRISAERGEVFLPRYGGKLSSESMIPKIWHTLNEAPEIYEAADYFIEAADWIVWQLTGVLSRNACAAGYKSMWSKKDGYPDPAFFRALDPRLERVVLDKLAGPVVPIASRVGGVTASASEMTGLPEGIAVAAGTVDAHVAVPTANIDRPGKLLAIIGTSTCHMILGEEERRVPGICGYSEDGLMPGYFGYEAGQTCVGDHFAWFVDHCVPAEYKAAAEAEGLSVHQYLTRLADQYTPGQSGLLALDWWNGNRSILVDMDLTGMFLGMTLQTKPEELYRALIEATAYGTRMITDNYRANGIEVRECYATGGISQKNPMMMQIYADVLNMPVYLTETTQCGALGSAIMASVAAGSEAGGYRDLPEASAQMGRIKPDPYLPNPEHVAVYDALFQEYARLHEYFGRHNHVMKRLKQLKHRQLID